MKAIFILLLIIGVLYAMKVIAFDMELLKNKVSQFKNWCVNLYDSLKNKFDEFIDFFNKKTGNVD
jgi:hypothetical protein